jgi:hypothetical protein
MSNREMVTVELTNNFKLVFSLILSQDLVKYAVGIPTIRHIVEMHCFNTNESFTLTGVKAWEFLHFYNYKQKLWCTEGTKEHKQTTDTLLKGIYKKFNK